MLKEIQKNPHRTVVDISICLNVNVLSVYQCAKNNGIKLKKHKSKVLEEILRNPNRTARKIADYMEVYTTSVFRIAKKYNIKLEQIVYESEKIRKEILRNPNRTLREIADYMGVSIGNVKWSAKYMGIKLKPQRRKKEFVNKKIRYANNNTVNKGTIKYELINNPNRTTKEIADYLNVKKNSVIALSNVMGIKLIKEDNDFEKLTKKIREEIIKNPKRTAKEISKICGCIDKTVSRCAKKMNVRLMLGRKKENVIYEIKRDSNRTVKHIAEYLRVSYSFVWQCAKDMNVSLKSERDNMKSDRRDKLLFR